MAKLFYSFKEDELYQLMKECSLETLMKEQCITDGLLIWTHDGVVETVLYMDAMPRLFETRIYEHDGKCVMEHQSPGHKCVAKIGEDKTLSNLAKEILSWPCI